MDEFASYDTIDPEDEERISAEIGALLDMLPDPVRRKYILRHHLENSPPTPPNPTGRPKELSSEDDEANYKMHVDIRRLVLPRENKEVRRNVIIKYLNLEPNDECEDKRKRVWRRLTNIANGRDTPVNTAARKLFEELPTEEQDRRRKKVASLRPVKTASFKGSDNSVQLNDV